MPRYRTFRAVRGFAVGHGGQLKPSNKVSPVNDSSNFTPPPSSLLTPSLPPRAAEPLPPLVLGRSATAGSEPDSDGRPRDGDSPVMELDRSRTSNGAADTDFDKKLDREGKGSNIDYGNLLGNL